MREKIIRKAHILAPPQSHSFLFSFPFFSNLFSLFSLSPFLYLSLKKPVMVVAKDEWVATALTDDQMVVELLLRLKHAGTVESDNNPAANLPLLRWGFRQRRSRPSRLGVGGFLKKETDSARASPMTPLCWSGGSGSGGSTCPSAVTADCFEDTSRQTSCSTSTGSGSKVCSIRLIRFSKSHSSPESSFWFRSGR